MLSHSSVRWQRDCFVVPPLPDRFPPDRDGRQVRSDIIAMTRYEKEAISKHYFIIGLTLNVIYYPKNISSMIDFVSCVHEQKNNFKPF